MTSRAPASEDALRIASARSLDLGWTTLGYHDLGVGTEPIILLHGAGAGATSWSNFVRNIPVLAEHRRVIALDLPGFGRSDAYVVTTEPRQTMTARAVGELMDALGIERADLVGNSLGGGAALALAVDRPQQVKKMVIMGSAGSSTFVTERPTEGINALQAVYRNPSVATFRAFFDIMLYDSSSVPDHVLQERADGVRPEQVDAFLRSNASPHRDLAADLPRITAPTLVLHGRNDRVVPFEAGLGLFAELPHSELHAFNRCGHWVQYEHPDHFNRMVLDFFARP